MTDAVASPDSKLSLSLACPVCKVEREPVTADGWLYDRCASCRRDDLVPRRWPAPVVAILSLDGSSIADRFLTSTGTAA